MGSVARRLGLEDSLELVLSADLSPNCTEAILEFLSLLRAIELKPPCYLNLKV